MARNKKVAQTVPKPPEKPHVTVKRISRFKYRIDLYTWWSRSWDGTPTVSRSVEWTVFGRDAAHKKAKRELDRYLRKHGYTTEAETRYSAKD